jgi:hypothetical protein
VTERTKRVVGATVTLAVAGTAAFLLLTGPPAPPPAAPIAPPYTNRIVSTNLIGVAWTYDVSAPNILFELRETTNFVNWKSIFTTNWGVTLTQKQYAFFILRAYDTQRRLYSDWTRRTNN